MGQSQLFSNYLLKAKNSHLVVMSDLPERSLWRVLEKSASHSLPFTEVSQGCGNQFNWKPLVHAFVWGKIVSSEAFFSYLILLWIYFLKNRIHKSKIFFLRQDCFPVLPKIFSWWNIIHTKVYKIHTVERIT